MRLWANLAPSSALCCVFCCFSRNDAFLSFRPMFLTAYRWCLACFTVFSDPAVSNCMKSSGIHLPTPLLNKQCFFLTQTFFTFFPCIYFVLFFHFLRIEVSWTHNKLCVFKAYGLIRFDMDIPVTPSPQSRYWTRRSLQVSLCPL